MYCKRCKFHSFDHISACPKCGADWEETRKALYLNWLTSSGYNWLTTPDTLSAPTAQADSATLVATNTPQPIVQEASLPDADNMFLDIDTFIPPVPPVSTVVNEGLDVGLLPELNLELEETSPTAAIGSPTTPGVKEAATEVASEIYLDLDDLEPATLTAATPASAQPPRTSSKRDDLFIPELEEMLAPLAEDFTTSQPKKSAQFDQEDDIVLDFGPATDDDIIVIEDTDDLDIISIDDPKKQP